MVNTVASIWSRLPPCELLFSWLVMDDSHTLESVGHHYYCGNAERSQCFFKGWTSPSMMCFSIFLSLSCSTSCPLKPLEGFLTFYSLITSLLPLEILIPQYVTYLLVYAVLSANHCNKYVLFISPLLPTSAKNQFFTHGAILIFIENLCFLEKKNKKALIILSFFLLLGERQFDIIKGLETWESEKMGVLFLPLPAVWSWENTSKSYFISSKM